MLTLCIEALIKVAVPISVFHAICMKVTLPKFYMLSMTVAYGTLPSSEKKSPMAAKGLRKYSLFLPSI